MIIRLTEKLSKKLKTGPLTKIDTDPGPFLDWYAHLFSANRAQYILTTEAKSLLSIVMFGRGITDGDLFFRHWLSLMREYLADTGNRFVFERIIGPQTGLFIFSKTLSKSVLGSMNDMVNISKTMLSIKDLSPWELSQMLNDTPFKAIEYQRPLNAFSKTRLPSK